MTIAETARLIAILKMAWPAHPIEAEQGAAVYHRALADIPFELAERAVDEWLRTGKFFPAPSEIRELALRAGVGLPAAEIAWQEAQRVVGGYRPGDPAPLWSSRVLEEAVNAVGWSAIKACEADQLGTLRAQFRDTYNALLKRMTADDARDALTEAEGRRALIAFVPRQAPALEAGPPRGPAPIPDASPDEPTEPGESWTLRKFRERFAAKHPTPGAAPASGLSKPSGTDYLQSLPAWKALSPERRERLLREHEARKAAQ
jgi:hypothetical protein